MRHALLLTCIIGCSVRAADAERLRIDSVLPEVVALGSSPRLLIAAAFTPSLAVSYRSGEPSSIDTAYGAAAGGLALEDVAWRDAGRLDATLPSGLAEGAYDLVVTAPDGRSATRTRAFQVLCLESRDWFVDADGDGYGVSPAASAGCAQPAGHSSTSGDCNDAVATAFPGAPERCGNGVDDDCDGADVACPTMCADADGDGFPDAACGGDDCDDGDPAVIPGGRCDDGDVCTGNDRCSAGVCAGTLDPTACPQTCDACSSCTSGECCETACTDTGCSTCSPGCGCALTCENVNQCHTTCSGGASCVLDANGAHKVSITCDQSHCELTCNSVDLSDASECRLACNAGSTCELRCNSVTSCLLECGPGAECLIDRNSAGGGLGGCSSPIDCGDGVTVCNRSCP